MNQARLNVNAPLAAVVAANRRFSDSRINKVVGIVDSVGGDNNLFVALKTLYAVALCNHSGVDYTADGALREAKAKMLRPSFLTFP